MRKSTIASILAALALLLCAGSGAYMILTASSSIDLLPEISWGAVVAQIPALGYILGLIAMLMGLIFIVAGIAIYSWMCRLIDRVAEKERQHDLLRNLAAKKGES